MTDEYLKKLEKAVEKLNKTISTQFTVTPETIDEVYRRWVGAKRGKGDVEYTEIDDAASALISPMQQVFTRPNKYNLLIPANEEDLGYILYPVPLLTTYLSPIIMFVAGVVGGKRKAEAEADDYIEDIMKNYSKRVRELRETYIPRALNEISAILQGYRMLSSDEVGIIDPNEETFEDFLYAKTIPEIEATA